MNRNGAYIKPYIVVSLGLIFLFVFFSSLHKDPVKSKPWEAVGAVLCTVMSVVASFGLLIGFGFKFIALYSVVPFLVLAIGVDDSFIILHAWHKTDPKAPVRERMAEALSDAGPSITMTSLTNATSFLIGAISLTPGIHGFCVFAATGISIVFLFQVCSPTPTVSVSPKHAQGLIVALPLLSEEFHFSTNVLGTSRVMMHTVEAPGILPIATAPV